MMNKMSRKGVAPIAVIGIALAVILVVYLILFIPIPAFTKLRQSINYYLVVALWIVIQASVVYGVYKVIMYINQGIKIYKNNLLKIDTKIKDFILTH